MRADGKVHGFLLSDGSFSTIDFPGATEIGAEGTVTVIWGVSAAMSDFFGHCGIKYSLDQASWLNSRIAALASEAGERRGTGASIITGRGILKPNTTNAEIVKA
jgi:hypothetical protein